MGTFAKKLHSKITKITERFGDPLTITVNEKQELLTLEKGVIITNRTFRLLTYAEMKKTKRYKKFDWKSQYPASMATSDVFKPMNSINWRTLRNLTNVCAICGTFDKVEMHHLRHIKKGKVIGFQQVLNQLNRTTIPLCETHHKEVHDGKYDHINLQDLYGLERFLS